MLWQSNIESLPCSIGRLQSLQDLDLSITYKLKGLPDEIGNLGSLVKLVLWQSNIESLPCSIGRLKSVRELHLGDTEELKGLPDETGNLGSLVKLDLQKSNIESLPCSIGRLQSLQELDLSFTYKLKGLLDEIGNLGSLVKLDIRASNIESFSLLFEYTLVCSRFRYRVAIAPSSMKMGWPHLLGNARRWFRFYVSGIGDLGLEEPDAIYCILAHFRGPIVEAIAHANASQRQKTKTKKDEPKTAHKLHLTR